MSKVVIEYKARYNILLAFIFGILGQVWYLIASIPDTCCRSYFFICLSVFAYQYFVDSNNKKSDMIIKVYNATKICLYTYTLTEMKICEIFSGSWMIQMLILMYPKPKLEGQEFLSFSVLSCNSNEIWQPCFLFVYVYY